MKKYLLLVLLITPFLVVSCGSKSDNEGDSNTNIEENYTPTFTNLITPKKLSYKLDEPLDIACKGKGENWVGLYKNDENPLLYAYLKDVKENEYFDLRAMSKGIYHNGWQEIKEGTYSLKWYENNSSSYDSAKYSIDIKFTKGSLGKPIRASYTLDNETDGYAKGKLKVIVDEKYINNTNIRMYWANEKGRLKDYKCLPEFEVTAKETTFEIPSRTLIPHEATKLHIHTARNEDESEKYLTYNLPANSSYTETSNLLYTYTVCSDTQLQSDTKDSSHNSLREAFRDIQTYSPTSQAILINGDVCEHGYEAEYQALYHTYNEFKNLPPMFYSIGNHELQFGTDSDSLKEYNDIFLKYATLPDGSHPTSTNYDFYHNGYHFVMVGNDKEFYSHEINLTDESLTWLDTTIGKSYSETKPTFIFMHQPIHNTVAGSLKNQGWHGVNEKTEGKLREILKKYNKAFLFTGHTHWTLDSFQNIYTDDINMPYCLNTGAVAYEWTTFGNTYGKGIYVGNVEGYIMEIYDDKVIFKGRDYWNHRYIPGAYYCFEF